MTLKLGCLVVDCVLLKRRSKSPKMEIEPCEYGRDWRLNEVTMTFAGRE